MMNIRRWLVALVMAVVPLVAGCQNFCHCRNTSATPVTERPS